MRYSRTSPWFWAWMGSGAVLVAAQSVALFGWLAAPMGIGSGASLGLVIFYLAAMVQNAVRWAFQWFKPSSNAAPTLRANSGSKGDY